jgi:hypothetical protein
MPTISTPGSVSLRAKFRAPDLNPGLLEMKKSKSELGAMLFDRSPERLVGRVVVDYDDFKIGVIELRQGVQRFLHHFRRLVVRGDVNGHARKVVRHRSRLDDPSPSDAANHVQDLVAARRKEEERERLETKENQREHEADRPQV